MSQLRTTTNGHMTSIFAQIEITNLSLKNSTKVSLKNSKVHMSLMHTSQFEIINLSLKNSTNLSLKNSRVLKMSFMHISQFEITNLSLKNSRVHISVGVQI